ncbi:hypothetical protein C0J52_15963 [Blattella germanica]|nr:hypothetical protein C0J52_15963 [Blattella germanica]
MSIHSKASAYRNTQKIFQLAHKLRVCGKDQRLREGKVLVLIAEAALEAQLLHDKINTLLKQEVVSDEEEFSDALTSPLTPNKEFQSLINIIEEAVEPIVRNSAYISPSTPGSKSLSVSQDDSETSGSYSITQQGFPVFYFSLAPDCHASSLCTQYDKFSEPVVMDPVLKVSQAFLRSLQLEGTISHGRFVNNTKGTL